MTRREGAQNHVFTTAKNNAEFLHRSTKFVDLEKMWISTKYRNLISCQRARDTGSILLPLSAPPYFLEVLCSEVDPASGLQESHYMLDG